MRLVLLFVLIDRLGFAPINTTFHLILVQNGISKETLSSIQIISAPFMLVFAVIITKYFTKWMKITALSPLMMTKFFV